MVNVRFFTIERQYIAEINDVVTFIAQVYNQEGGGTMFSRVIDNETGAVLYELPYDIGDTTFKQLSHNITCTGDKWYTWEIGSGHPSTGTITDSKQIHIKISSETPPIVEITSLTKDDTIESGQDTTISWTVKNNGSHQVVFYRLYDKDTTQTLKGKSFTAYAGQTRSDNVTFTATSTRTLRLECGYKDGPTEYMTDVREWTLIVNDKLNLPDLQIISVDYEDASFPGEVKRIVVLAKNQGTPGLVRVQLYNITTNELLQNKNAVLVFGGEVTLFEDVAIHEMYNFRVITEHYVGGEWVQDDFFDFRIFPEITPSYTLTVTTRPTNCTVELVGVETLNSGIDGFVTFWNIEAGTYTVIVSKSGLDTRTQTVLVNTDLGIVIDITEAPDFWTDPIGWIQYFVVITIENLLGWINGSFLSTLQQVYDFFGGIYQDIAQFFSDVSASIMATVQPFLDNIASWFDETFANIGAWWDSVAVGIGEWWSASLESMGIWWTDFVANTSDWIYNSWDDLIVAVNEVVSDVWSWTVDQFGAVWEGIQTFLSDLINDLAEAIFGGLDDGIENGKNKRK